MRLTPVEREASGPTSEAPSPDEAGAEAVEILRFEHVGKAFRRFEHKPFLLRNMLLRLVGRAPKPRELWPLKDVSFTVRRGETVGVVGQNGAGKSTLLRLIAGACFPTSGKISVRGRIAPLLSLGAGFHPDMTGRECIEINATALGLTKGELDERLDSITAFAELGEFLDTPTRYYSSGMLARLGFAVAVHTAPDLLLVDEVLSVGDHNFQRKCMAKIRELQASGVTILFVSHSADSMRELCSRVIWLREGLVVGDGPPDQVFVDYLQA